MKKIMSILFVIGLMGCSLSAMVGQVIDVKGDYAFVLVHVGLTMPIDLAKKPLPKKMRLNDGKFGWVKKVKVSDLQKKQEVPREVRQMASVGVSLLARKGLRYLDIDEKSSKEMAKEIGKGVTDWYLGEEKKEPKGFLEKLGDLFNV